MTGVRRRPPGDMSRAEVGLWARLVAGAAAGGPTAAGSGVRTPPAGPVRPPITSHGVAALGGGPRVCSASAGSAPGAAPAAGTGLAGAAWRSLGLCDDIARRRRAARAAALRRHPSSVGWRFDRRRLLERLAARAGADGAAWPRVAAVVVALRGVAGDDSATFAARVGVPLAVLTRLEAGGLSSRHVPRRVRAAAGPLDWAWVEAGPRGSPRPP